MKSILKNTINFFNSHDVCFITVDSNSVACFVYRNFSAPNKQIIAVSNIEVKATSKNNKLMLEEVSYAIAKCLDIVEAKIKRRIKKVILNLAISNAKSMLYETELKVDNNFTFKNLGKYIDINAMSYLLGEDYFLTNFYPQEFTETRVDLKGELKNLNITFLIAGYNKQLVLKLYDLFNNLFIAIDGIMFSPLTLPFLVNNYDHEVNSILHLSSNNSLLYDHKKIEFIEFGNNFILEQISFKTSIPIEVIAENSEAISNLLESNESQNNNQIIKIEEYMVENIAKIIEEAVLNYAKNLKKLIVKYSLLEDGKKLIIIDNELEYFNKQDVFESVLDTENIELKKFIIDNNPHMQNIKNSDILNMGLVKYYYLKTMQDLGFITFKVRLQKMVDINK